MNKKINQEHEKLVNKIKKANKDGIRNSFLDTAEALYLIKKKQTYKSIKPDDIKYTFEKYCLETKYLPGSTPNARRTLASKLILIYQLYVAKKAPKNVLLGLGYAKSYELAKFYFRHPDTNIKKLIEDTGELNHNDFARMLSERACDHTDIITVKVKMCRKCKKVIRILD
jgi:hypothetical protein